MKQKISKSVISLLLTFAVLFSSIPLMSWSAIAQTIVPAVLSAEDSSVSSTSASDTVAETGDSNDLTVYYPTASDSNVYVEGNGSIGDNYTVDGYTDEEVIAFCEAHMALGVFDPICYVQLNPTLINPDFGYATQNGNTVTYNTYRLYSHWLNYGISEGRCASPFFCICCYLTENADLLNAFKDTENPYMSAWNHFNSYLDNVENRVLSPILNINEYRVLNPDLASATNRQVIEHFMTHGRNANDLRRGSIRVDNIAYFYNNNSIYHSENGVIECYRKLINDITPDNVLPSGSIESGCFLHKDAKYSGVAQLEDSFTCTLTSVGVMKNLALSDDGTSVVSVTPGNTDNELWLFEKTDDGYYSIRLATTDDNVKYDSTDSKEFYLGGQITSSGVQIYVSDTPFSWSVFESDGLYVLRPEISGSMHREMLNITNDGVVNITNFGNPTSPSTLYNGDTMNQRFVFNTTYESVADSDGLSADFYASIDAFSTFGGMDTKVALTLGDKYLRTRELADGGTSAADQNWHFIRQSDGTYKIQNTACSLYLSSEEGPVKVENNPNVENSNYEYSACYVTENDNSDYQKWVIRKRNDGGYLIMPVKWQDFFDEGANLRVVEESGLTGTGSLLYIDSFKGKQFSVFDIKPTVAQPHAYDLNGDEDFFAYISSGKAEYVDYYIKNNETQYGVEKKFVDTTNQDIKKHDYYWRFKKLYDGSYQIMSTTTVDACLTYSDGKVYLDEVSAVKGLHQTWYLFKYNGGFRLQLKETGEVLQMAEDGSLTVAPANTNNYNDFQLFNITETDMSIDTSAETFKMNLFNYGTRINDSSDPSHILDFFSGNNDGLDKKYMSIGASDGVIPQMSKVLDENNYPYVKNYAYVNSLPNGIAGGVSYSVPVDHNKTPNFYRSGSLQYLFDESIGFNKGDNSQISEYNPTAVNGDEYQSQSFKVVNPSGLFQKDEQGYYYYDSSQNAAHFNIDYSNKSNGGVLSGTFNVYDYLAHPVGNAPLVDLEYQGMFLPFNIPHEQGTLCYGNGIDESNVINYGSSGSTVDKANYTMPKLSRDQNNQNESGDREKAIDMWFGMTLETDFYQTKDGILNGQEMKFEFSGDDDVWVYLDGILSLDIGNTHGKITGEINFANSTVTRPVKTDYNNPFASASEPNTVTYADNSKGQMWKKNDDGTYAHETVSLYSIYYAAYEEVTGEKKTELEKTIKRSFVLTGETLPEPEGVNSDPKLKDYEQHNLKFYYLERGSGAANCKIKFNTFSNGTTVSKKVSNLNKEIMDAKEYEFKVVSVDEKGNESPYADCPYTVSSTSNRAVLDASLITDFTTDENGCFTLKANQKAIFGKIAPGSKIKVYEVDSDDAITTQWHTEVFNSETGKKESSKKTLGLTTDVISTPVDSTLDIIFTNNYAPSQYICIQKGFNEENSSDTYKPDDFQIYVVGYQLINPYGEIVVSNKITLHQGGAYEINSIPVGYKYRVWEYTPEGDLNFDSPVFSINEGAAIVKTFVPQGSNPGANSYIEGTVEKNKDYTILLTNKLAQRGNIDITFKYYDRTRTNGAPAQINEYYSTFKTVLEPEDWEKYVNSSTQRINFSKMIADQGIYFNKEVAVDNIIDEYVVWTSQKEAEEGFATQCNYFAGKNDEGQYSNYGSTNPDMLSYHTDASGNICNCGEKWITYYQGGKVIDPETQGNDTDVTAITVWLFNRPKTYTVKMHTITPDDLSTATVVDGFYVGNKAVTFNAFYNQRIANTPDADFTERDEMNSQNYLDIYNIPESDIITGVDDLQQTVEYLDLPQTIVDDSEENKPYTFMYWSYDEQGRTVASTSINYAYRITNNMELYAVYGESPLDTPGLTAFRNCTDYYVDENGVHKVRLNTMMNPYNCPDKDETITDAAILYVMLHGSQQYKNYTEAQLIEALYNTNDEGVTYLEMLREGIKNLLESNATKGAVTVVDATLTANGFRYEVESASGNTQKLNLTTKNRLQFTTEFSETAINGKRLLAFTAMNKDNNWIVSDNYIDYCDFFNK